MDKLLSYAYKLRELIKENRHASCEDALKLIEQEPLMLAANIDTGTVENSSPAALNSAIFYNNLGVTEAILQTLAKEKVTKAIKKQVGKSSCSLHYPLGDVMYSKETMGTEDNHLPHDFIKSEKMLRLLHKYGYDLSANRQEIFEKHELQSFPFTLVDRLKFGLLVDNKRCVPLLRATLELAIDQKEDPSCWDGKDTFANYIFTEMMDPLKKGLWGFEPYKNKQKDWESKRDVVFQACAKAGVDFRKTLDIYNSGENSLALETLRNYCDTMVSSYFVADTKAERMDCAGAACSVGFFPKLLNRCVEEDKQSRAPKKLPQLISYLSDHWKDEYKNLIRAATAVSSRTSLVHKDVRKSPLEAYARDITFSPGKG